MRLSRATGTSRRTVGAVIASAALRFGVSAPLTIIILPVALRRLSTAEYGVWAVLSVFLAIGYFAELRHIEASQRAHVRLHHMR